MVCQKRLEYLFIKIKMILKELKINLENCYGIRKLKHTFDFTNKKTYAIYAPNGSMKTSFAKTFLDLSNGDEPTDLMFPERETTWEINYDGDTELLSENIFVIKSYGGLLSSIISAMHILEIFDFL